MTLAAALVASPLLAEPVRLATWGADLSRDGPGLLLRDILGGEDPSVEGVAEILGATRPDILLLTDIDWDLDGAALTALADRLAEEGLDYPHRLALRPNAGLASGSTSTAMAGRASHGTRRATGASWGRAAWRSCPAIRWARCGTSQTSSGGTCRARACP